MKKLGIVGYYGHGNFGDELFLYAFRNFFPPNEFRLDLLSHSADHMRKYRDDRLTRIKSTYTAIIIGGGDILIPGYDIADQYLLPEFLEVPVFVNGVGVPLWSGVDAVACTKMRKFLGSDAIADICTRDKESADWINSEMQPKASARYTEDIVFSLANSVEARTARSAEPRRIGIVMRGGQWVPTCKMKDFTHKLIAEGYQLKFLMLGTGKELDYDLKAVQELDCLASPQVDVVVRQSDTDLLHAFDEVDAVYSMKFHGCIAALMHGLPVVALITTDKFKNLYRRLGLDRFIIHHTSSALLDSVPLLATFPNLDINGLCAASSASLARLRASIDRLPGPVANI